MMRMFYVYLLSTLPLLITRISCNLILTSALIGPTVHLQRLILLNVSMCPLPQFYQMSLSLSGIPRLKKPTMYWHLVACLSSALDFSSYMRNVTSSFRGRVFLISQMCRPLLPLSALCLLYKCYVRPLLEYAVPVWSPHASCQQFSTLIWMDLEVKYSLDITMASHGAFPLCLVEYIVTLLTVGSHEVQDTGSTNNTKLQMTVSSQNNSLLRTCVSKNSVWSSDCISPTQAQLMRSEFSEARVLSRELFWLLTVIWSLVLLVLPVSWTSWWQCIQRGRAEKLHVKQLLYLVVVIGQAPGFSGLLTPVCHE